jgi:serine/threonine-protein kinase
MLHSSAAVGRGAIYTGEAVVPPASRFELGQILEERYCLERVLGRGGMGMVFAARHIELRELVAIKLLHDDSLRNPVHVDRFIREARLASRLKGDHVVRILDVVRGRGEMPPYIVMEYLEGEDLFDLLSSLGPLPTGLAVDYVLQACEAVAEAHRVGIVHRDLKPANLLVTSRPDGTPLVKVLDFGISKSDDQDDAGLTTTMTVVGSPSYMSPEQLRSSKSVDARTDIWALAVILFELLTGKRPFVGETSTAVLAAIAADPPLELTTLAPTVPGALQEVIEACLAKNRDERVGSVAELATLLEPFATPQGRLSVEAIYGIAQMPLPPSLLSLPDAPPSLPSGASLESEASLAPVMNRTESTSIDQVRLAAPPAPPRSRALWLAAAGAALVLLSVSATWTVLTRPLPGGSAAPAAATSTAPLAVSVSSPPPEASTPPLASASAARSAGAEPRPAPRIAPLPITRSR